MGKAINAFVSAQDETSENVQGTRLIFLDFSVPKVGAREKFIPRKKARIPHERVVTEQREVKYLRDGYVKEEGDLKPRRVVLESYGFETVTEVLVPRGFVLPSMNENGFKPALVGRVIRDLRRKEENV